MELPRGTTVKYYEKENIIVNKSFFKELDNNFEGYVRVFGKNSSAIEDNYLLFREGNVIAAYTEIDTEKRIHGAEALDHVTKRRYDHGEG